MKLLIKILLIGVFVTPLSINPLLGEQILHLACDHALRGSHQASYYLSSRFQDTDDDIYSFWLLTSSIQGRYLSDEEIKHLKAREDIYSAVIHCILDKGMCFSTALAERREHEQKFFKEYYERKPLGWPNYEMAAEIFLENRIKVCSGAHLKRRLFANQEHPNIPTNDMEKTNGN